MKKRRLMIAILTSSFVALVAVGKWQQDRIQAQLNQFIARFTPAIRSIEVHSRAGIDKKEIVRLSELKVGTPLLFLDSQEVTKKITTHPEIKHVRVSRRLTGDVVIGVSLREPVAIVAGSKLSYTDSEGNIFKFLTHKDRTDYPVITGVPDDWEIMSSNRREIIRGALKLLGAVAQQLPSKQLPISEVNVDPSVGYSLFSSKISGPIIVGLPPFFERIERLRQIFDRLQDKLIDIETIDLDYNSKAFVRFKHQEALTIAQLDEQLNQRKRLEKGGH